MVKVAGTIDTVAISVPVSLNEKFEYATTYALTEREAHLFLVALSGVELQLKEEKVDFADLSKVCVIFTENGTFTLEADSIGYQINFVVFGIKKWRDAKWTERNILTAYVEELCHHYLRIEDEEVVKHKVLEVVNRVLETKFKFNDLYSENWKEAYPDIYGKEKQGE